MNKEQNFETELISLINKNSMENNSDTPDYILGRYIMDCLISYQNAINARDAWFQVDMWTEDKRSRDFHEYK
jgi:hypothetical protein